MSSYPDQERGSQGLSESEIREESSRLQTCSRRPTVSFLPWQFCLCRLDVAPSCWNWPFTHLGVTTQWKPSRRIFNTKISSWSYWNIEVNALWNSCGNMVRHLPLGLLLYLLGLCSGSRTFSLGVSRLWIVLCCPLIILTFTNHGVRNVGPDQYVLILKLCFDSYWTITQCFLLYLPSSKSSIRQAG